MQNPTTLERAFDLARSGTCANIDEIRLTLKRERFDQVEAHLAGHSIKKQLRALCETASSPAAGVRG
jgi:Zn finger protein HypA/HybF involved in hydrogenase expression